MSTATLSTPISPRTSSSTDEAKILTVIETMLKANYTKNAATFAAQFASDATIYNLAPPLVHHGVNIEEKQAWLDSWETPVSLESRDLEVTVSGDLAFCHGFLRMSGTKKGAEREVDFWMRETLCLQRVAGNWQIVHEHTSVPFYMDGTLRPAFDLRP
ncbi:MAG: nuclear transport factor 2 family protein [Terracidiphilus sp.]|jgi:ketosteroid isomerase-like protein